ncbi:MAG: hypothetical protein ACFFA0_15375 [Promethearchaeota archaeon]
MFKKQNYLIIGCILLFFVGSSFSFWASSKSNESEDDIIESTGKIVYLSFEGGFYGIEANDGNHYDPINLPNEFKIDGLLIVFKAKILRDRISFHMWGEIVELLFIESLI